MQKELQVIGDYKIKSLLSIGNGYKLYLVTKNKVNKEFVIKLFQIPYTLNPSLQEKIDYEYKIVNKLISPNIISYFEKGVYDGCPFIVMSFLGNNSLQNLLELNGQAPFEIAVAVFYELLQGLSYLHENKIIHLNLKLSNIFLNANGNIIIADFGMAKYYSDINMKFDNFQIGSPRYISPEQLQGENLSALSDIYSVGILFYIFLTNKSPWNENDARYRKQKDWSNWKKPSRLVQEGGTKLDNFFERAIAYRPEQRFQSVQEMAMALQAFPMASEKDIFDWINGRKFYRSFTKEKRVKISKRRVILLSIICALFLIIIILLIRLLSN